MKTNALFSSKSFPAGSSAWRGQYQHWRKHEEEEEEEEGEHCGPDSGRGRLTTVEFIEFNNSPLNTREEEARFGVLRG